MNNQFQITDLLARDQVGYAEHLHEDPLLPPRQSKLMLSVNALKVCLASVCCAAADANSYRLRGTVRAKIGSHKEALADLTRYVQMRPNDGNGLLERGELLIKMGDSAEGCRDLYRAIDLFTQ
jgi:hypothetical protein